MVRKIVAIDDTKCTGCGLCLDTCHESAIKMEDGKARLIKDDYCDGLGDCLPVCPAGAISIIEREAADYDEAAVKARRNLARESRSPQQLETECHFEPVSELRTWPVQIQLSPVKAQYFDGAKLLIASDCTAYAYADFHRDFLRGKVALIGCPKLDHVDYGGKLAEILRQNDIESVHLIRMEVPCCGGMEHAVKNAFSRSGKTLPCRVTTLSTDGRIIGR